MCHPTGFGGVKLRKTRFGRVSTMQHQVLFAGEDSVPRLDETFLPRLFIQLCVQNLAYFVEPIA